MNIYKLYVVNVSHNVNSNRGKYKMALKILDFSSFGKIKDLMTCCGGTVEFVGVFGILLLIAGTLQMGSGVYFMLTLPVFSVASNIWTGVVSGLAGTVLTYFGCSDQSRRRPYVLFTFCIVTIVANVANIVITQVGDKTLNVFNEESFLSNLDDDKQFTLQIGLWVTTGATILSLASAFILANYLFWVQLKGKCEADKQSPLLKTISEEILQKTSRPKSKKGGNPNRFFPPSRLINDSKVENQRLNSEHIQNLPSLEDVLTLPNPNFTNGNSSWVYNSDDKISLGLYPLGLEADILETSVGHPPARHSSFAAPRYAKVNKRPQRAQSFETRRDPFSIHYDNPLLKPCPVLIPRLPHDCGSRVRRSNSLTTESSNGRVSRTLSNKYRAFTLDREVDPQVLEVGSMKSSSSEHSLANALTNLQTEKTKIRTLEKYTAFNKLSDNENCSSLTLKGSTLLLTKGFRTKGPAPPPPTKNITRNSVELMLPSVHKQSKEFNSLIGDKDSNMPKKVPVESGSEIETQNEMEELNNSETYDSHSERFQIDYHISKEKLDISKGEVEVFTSKSQRKEQLTHFSALRNGEIQKPLRLSIVDDIHPSNINPQMQMTPDGGKILAMNDLNLGETTIPENDEIHSVRTALQNSNQGILVCSPTKSILKDISANYSHYDTIRKQITDESKNQVEMLPNKDVQRNKIVLRVPSFKTTGCQTENYRPVKRRNTLCSQGQNTLCNRRPNEQLCKMAVWRPQHEIEEQKLMALSTSSSGYSSPERNSKESSPIHSGPPSPGSSHETGTEEEFSCCDQNGPNVTIIEVNKGHDKQFKTPARPPKPFRYRPVSDASTFYRQGISPYLKKTSIPIPIWEDTFAMAKMPENITLLTEAVNPLMMQNRNYSTTTPRIVNVLEKSTTPQPELPCKNIDPNNNQKIPINHASIHRFCNEMVESQQFSKRNESESPSLSLNNRNFFESSSTAAYLASLELLASHYRQQALANAKQLQRQQRLLDQQKKHSETNSEAVQIGNISELDQPHDFVFRNNRNTE